MQLNSEDLTFDQILCRMADGQELVCDDLGDWLFSGVHWTILPEDTIKELVREGVVEKYYDSDLCKDGAFERYYRLTSKGLKTAGLVAPMVRVGRIDDDAHAAMHLVFWIVALLSLTVLIVYRILQG